MKTALVCLVMLALGVVFAHPKAKDDHVTKWWSKYLPDQKNCGVPIVTPKLMMERTIGGAEAVPGSWPWNVQVVFEAGGKCGGFIISKDWVLTAAHCFFGEGVILLEAAKCGILSVVSGVHTKYNLGDELNLANGEQRIWVKDVVIHPKFDPQTFKNDIALLRLESPLAFNAVVQPVCLPSPKMRAFGSRDVCVATGWGETDSADPTWVEEGTPGKSEAAKTLNQVILPLLSEKRCKKLTVSDIKVDRKKMLCAGMKGRDTCQGDSGGPLACRSSKSHNTDNRWVVLGITSFGEQNGGSCGGDVGVYTRVYTYSKWIKDTTRRPPSKGKKECNLPEPLVQSFKVGV